MSETLVTHLRQWKEYPEYKDSGVDWLQDIPAQWDMRRVRRLFRWNKGRIPERLASPSDIDAVPYLGMSYLRGDDDPTQWVLAAEGDVVADDDDIVLLWDGSNAGEFIRAKRGVVSSTAALIEPVGDPGSGYWFHMCKAFEPVLKSLTVGMGIPHVDGRYLGDIVCPLPPVNERSRIASFLDRETARINALVSEHERLIARLGEKRNAVIGGAVTRGLDPSVPMKDSGVEWLGRIPSHWHLRKLKHACERVFVGVAEAATFAYVDDGVPMLRSTDVRSSRIRTDDIRRIDRHFADRLPSKQLRTGDIVTVRTGNAGVSAVVPPEYDGGQCFTLVVSRPKRGHDSRYLCYWLNAPAGQQQFAVEGVGTAQINISVPIVKNMVICLPPPAEQGQIADHVDREVARSNALTVQIQAAIDRLMELRTTLISAAVTGKIDVQEGTA